MKALPDISTEYRSVNLLLLLGFTIFLIYPFGVSLPGLPSSYFPFDLPTPRSMMQQFPDAPCSSCGLTHSIVSLYHGKLATSLNYNPVGIVIVSMCVIQVMLRLIVALIRKSWLPWFDLAQLFICGLLVRLMLILSLQFG